MRSSKASKGAGKRQRGSDTSNLNLQIEVLKQAKEQVSIDIRKEFVYSDLKEQARFACKFTRDSNLFS